MSAREFRDGCGAARGARPSRSSPELADALERYYALLTKWNAKINLTSFKLEPAATMRPSIAC